MNAPTPARPFRFVGVDEGPWHVVAVHALAGELLAAPRALAMCAVFAVFGGEEPASDGGAARSLCGAVAGERDVTRDEVALVARQGPPGRQAADDAAFDAWSRVLRASPEWTDADREPALRTVREPA